MEPEEAARSYGYDRQLVLYAGYVESVMGEESVVKSEICWLNNLEAEEKTGE